MFSKDNPNEIRGTAEGVNVNALRDLPRVACLPGHLAAPVQAHAAAPASNLLYLRLSLDNLHSGGWISTREGDTERLWVVQQITPGAGDGGIEFTLVPHQL